MKRNRKQIIAAGLVFHILAAVFSIGYHHCDELFQVFEFAGYQLGLNSAADMPWEFHEQMRSGIQPFIVYGISKIAWTLHIYNPFTIAFIIRFLQSVLSFTAVLMLTNVLEPQLRSEKLKTWLWSGALFFWLMPYIHARFSSENFSATLFVIGLALTMKKPSLSYFFYAGIFMGLAFVARFHILFMIAGFTGWHLLLNKTKIKFLLLLFVGFMIAIGVGFLSDHWLYQKWTLSWWNYLDLNLFQNKAGEFGEQPFYYYITESLLQLVPPFSLVIVFAVILFWIKLRNHLVTWVTLPFVILHFFVGHKELRFLFPLLYFLPFMVLYYYDTFNIHNNFFKNIILSKGFGRLFVVVNTILLLFFTLKPADDISYSLKKIYDKVEGNPALLLYEAHDPYGNAAALNYFRKKTITTLPVSLDTLATGSQDVYYFSGSFNDPDVIKRNNREFMKIFSSYPSWFSYLDFNGWQDRTYSFSIYRRM